MEVKRRTLVTFEDEDEDEDVSVSKYQQDTICQTNYIKICLSKSYDFTIISINYIYKTFKFFINVSGIYFVWIFLHYVASHLYIKFCVPSTIFGFILSPFLAAAPQCQGLRWIVYTGGTTITTMWITLGTFLCAHLLAYPKLNR